MWTFVGSLFLATLINQRWALEANNGKLAPVVIGDREYLLLPGQENWFAARRLCLSLGYTLVVYETREQEQALVDYLMGSGLEKAYSPYWTEGNCLGYPFFTEYYAMTTGETLQYFNWHPLEPNNFENQNERCILAFVANEHYGSFSWNDQRCEDDGHVICYKPKK